MLTKLVSVPDPAAYTPVGQTFCGMLNRSSELSSVTSFTSPAVKIFTSPRLCASIWSISTPPWPARNTMVFPDRLVAKRT